jgi:hypothetical protein
MPRRELRQEDLFTFARQQYGKPFQGDSKGRPYMSAHLINVDNLLDHAHQGDRKGRPYVSAHLINVDNPLDHAQFPLGVFRHTVG